jgi:hypothetical protein
MHSNDLGLTEEVPLLNTTGERPRIYIFGILTLLRCRLTILTPPVDDDRSFKGVRSQSHKATTSTTCTRASIIRNCGRAMSSNIELDEDGVVWAAEGTIQGLASLFDTSTSYDM